MDMDDIPLPEELQWLESNTLLPEEEEDYYWQPPDPEEEEEEVEAAAAAAEQHKPEKKFLGSSGTNTSGTSEDHINGKKRPFSNVSSSFEQQVEEALPSSSSDAKRNRLLVHTETEIDEDWLRYDSTSRENVVESLPPSVVVMEEDEKIISRYASEVEGDCISVTGPCGDRVYAKISQLETDGVTNKKFNIRRSTKGLITEPVSTLLEGLEQDVLTKALQLRPESSGDLGDPQSSVVTEDLWVDKYAPSSFTELLSDEQTNREVLLWLKQWDSCVFGSEIRSTTDDVLSALRRHTSLAQHQKLSYTNSFRNNRGSYSTSKVSKHPDNSNRDVNNLKSMHDSWNKKPMGTGPPDQKVLLLCGPPGLGKTTLAHITAKHCGYRVVEINASDDRSSSMIEAKILDVVQMNSVMADAKPKCLVIDEIDGALGEGKGAVEVILKMVATERKSEDGKEYVAEKDQPGTISSKKGRKFPRLLRPVICICNDLYAPSLRQLRQVAKVHIFVKPTTSRVVSRLKYICNIEGLRTSSIALTALAEYTECDIRSCLNTLQFLNKKKETLNVLEISSQVVGRKDVSRSVFDVWKEVFQKRKTKGERKSISGFSSMHSDFDFLHSLICSRGEYELTMDGIHENILQLHYHDPMMQKTVKCLNILGDSDYLHQCIMRTQQMALYAYQPFTAIAIYHLVAQIRNPNIEWPKSSHRCRTKLIEKKDHLRCWHKKISPSISRHLSAESFVENDLSPLLYILSPPTLRPVAFHLLSEREKHDLDHLVNTMVSCSITYKSMKTETLTSIPRYEAASDAPTLTFDPPIGDFINFKFITDNGSNYKAAGAILEEQHPKMFWTPCAAHCVNLMLQEIGEKIPKIASVLVDARKLVVYIYNHGRVLFMMRKLTSGRELHRSCVTRFATSFYTLRSIHENRHHLQVLFVSEAWAKSAFAKKQEGKRMARIVSRNDFWDNVELACQILAPLVDVVRLVDTEIKPCMGYVYDAMVKAKDQIQKNLGNGPNTRLFTRVWEIVSRRWAGQFGHPLHAAGYYLNPSIYYKQDSSVIECNTDIKMGLYSAIDRLVPDPELNDNVLNQLIQYRENVGMFGTASAIRQRDRISAREWWMLYGIGAPDLQKFALKVLGLTCSASPCERNWSTFDNGYISYHSGLSLAIKQVLVHEVEKQRILCESICRSTNRNVGQDTKKLVSLKEKVDKTLSIRPNVTTAFAEKLENNDSSSRQCKANTSANITTLGSNTSITASMKPKASGVRKKQSGSSNFFDRFRNLSGKGSQNPDSDLQKPATSNRDSRPLIFKYNEGFTNAVKKPVRISELLS